MSAPDRRQDEGRKFNRQLCAEAASLVAELVTNSPYRRAIRCSRYTRDLCRVIGIACRAQGGQIGVIDEETSSYWRPARSSR